MVLGTHKIAPGRTVLVAEVGEVTPEVVDNAMTALGGTVTRRSAADVTTRSSRPAPPRKRPTPKPGGCCGSSGAPSTRTSGSSSRTRSSLRWGDALLLTLGDTPQCGVSPSHTERSAPEAVTIRPASTSVEEVVEEVKVQPHPKQIRPHHPVVRAQQAHRAADLQLRIADKITAFAGSMNFVCIHIVLFAAWMLFIESEP